MFATTLAKRCKPISVSALYYGGFFELMRHLQRKRVTILMYHRFSEKSEPFKLRQKDFDRQLHYLSRKYSIISFNECVRVFQGSRDGLPPNPLIITIDDGYQDNYEYAYPILKKYNAPATIFLTTDFISHKAWLWANQLEYILKNSSTPHFTFPVSDTDRVFQVDTFSGWHQTQLTLFNYCRTLENQKKDSLLEGLALQLGVQVPYEVTDAFLPLTWNQIREMQSSSIGYGSHACTHPIMSRLSDNELAHELNVSKNEIEKNTDAKVDVFCYPNGQPDDISETVIDHVRLSGYSAAVTTVPGFNQLDNREPYSLKRVVIGTSDHVSLTRELTRRN